MRAYNDPDAIHLRGPRTPRMGWVECKTYRVSEVTTLCDYPTNRLHLRDLCEACADARDPERTLRLQAGPSAPPPTYDQVLAQRDRLLAACKALTSALSDHFDGVDFPTTLLHDAWMEGIAAARAVSG